MKNPKKERFLMKFIRERVLNGAVMFGIRENLGSSMTVEMIGGRI